MGLVTERAGVVGLAAFLAIDVVLVALAMGSTHSAGSAATGAGPVGAAVTTTTTGAPATAATSPGTGSTVRVDVAPVSVGLFALDQNDGRAVHRRQLRQGRVCRRGHPGRGRHLDVSPCAVPDRRAAACPARQVPVRRRCRPGWRLCPLDPSRVESVGFVGEYQSGCGRLVP